VTQLFDAKSDCELYELSLEVEAIHSDRNIDLEDDSVFAVKNDLVVNFQPIPKDFKAPAELREKLVYELKHDFHLERLE